MSQQIINLGSGPDTQTGDTVYSAFVKVNENFTELYTVFGNDGVSINANVVLANTITTAGTVTATNLFAYDYVITNGNVVASNFLFPNGAPYAPLTQPDWSNVSASLIPRPNATYNIGSSANVFSNAYIGNTVFINGGALTYNGNLFLNGVQIGGLNAVTYDSESGNLTIESSDGQDFVVDIGVGRSDNPTFANLTTTGFANVNSLQVAGNTVIDSNATIRANNLPDSGVIVGTYGNATVVPVITVDAKGRVTTLTTTNVSGVSNVQYNNTTSNLTISTGDGTTYSVDLGVGTSDSPVFSGLSVSGNATVNALTVNGAVTIGGNIIPSANAVYNLGSLSNRFKDLFLTGNSLYLNTASITSNATAVTITNEQGGQFVIDGTSIGGASQISNGTSNVKVFANGNVDITAAGKTFNFDTLGNINAPGNVNVVANVVAPFFIGNIIGNVTGNLSAPGANTQILFNDNNTVGASNNFTFNKQSNNLTIGGSVIAANLNAAIIGNTGAVILSDTGTFTTKVTTANLASGPINANGTVTVNSLVSNGTVSGTTGTFTTSTTTSALNTGTLNANSTATVATLTSNGNITLGGNIIDTGALAIQTGSNGNISLEPAGTGVVVFTKDATGTSATFTTKITTANLATGAINANGTATVNALNSNGAISGTDATFTTKVTTSNLATGPINANGAVTVNSLISNAAVSGTIFTGTDATFTTKVITSNLATGEINANGIVTVSSLISNGAVSGTTGTFTTKVTTSNLATGAINANGTVTVDSLTSNGAVSGTTFTGTDATFTTKVTTGNLATGAINANGAVTVSSLISNGAVSGTTGTFTTSTTTSTLNTGTLNANGTATVNALTSNGAVSGTTFTGTDATFTTKVTTGNLATGAINANGTATVNALASNGAVSGTTFTGTDATFTTKVTTSNLATGAINANDSVTVNSLTSNGTIIAATLNAGTIGNIGASIVGASVSAATIGNTGTLLTGTLTTAAQPNITSVGSSLTIGTFLFQNDTITSTNGTITIDPANAGSTGNVIIEGNLRVTGNVTYIDSQTISINDKNILLANNTSNISDLNNGGIILGNLNDVGLVTWTYDTITSSWQSNVGITPAANASLNLGFTNRYWNTAYIDNIIGTSATFTTKVTTANLATGAINANGTATVNALTSNGTVSGTTFTGTDATFTTKVTTANLATGPINANGIVTVNSLVSNGAISGTTGTFTTSTTTSALNTGTLNANSTATVASLSSNTTITATGNITGGNLTTTGLLSVTGNISAGNLISNGEVTATGNITGGNIITSGSGGNISGANNISAVSLTASGNLTAGNVISNAAISGISFTGTDATFTTKVTTGNLATGAINANGTVTVNALTSNGVVSGTTGTFTTSTTTSALNTGTLNANSTATVASLTSNANITLSGNIIDTGALAIQTSSNGNISLEPDGTGVIVFAKDVTGTNGTFTTKVTTSNLATGAINANGTVTVNALASNGAVSGTTGTFTTSTTTDSLVSGAINSNANVTANGLTVNASATVGTTLTVAGNITATGGNIYSNNRIGFTYSANTTSVVYQVYNSATNSLDTVFG